MKLLVVEDEEKIALALKKGLEYEGYIVDVATDSDQALIFVASSTYDFVLLDWMLPGSYDGTALCKVLRAQNNAVPILMLTAKTSIGDKITGLDSGADDYLIKPFSFDELLARVRSLLRRPQIYILETITIDTLKLDTSKKTAQRAGLPIELTSKEFSLLAYLVKAGDRVVSKNELLENLWADDERPLPNTVEAFIKRLREKIDRPFPKEAPLLHTKRGFGYRLGAGHA